jgi:prevent-host-death family protein
MSEPGESMAISKFKATCLAVLERVRRTGQPVRITRFGKPVADIVPPAPSAKSETWIGGLRGRGRIAGDLVGPVVEASAWEALSEGVEESAGAKSGSPDRSSRGRSRR